MKLLLDQNLSFRLIKMLTQPFPSVSHIGQHNLINASDRSIWNFARDNDFLIISKDSDFHQLSFLYGHPPKNYMD